MPLPVNEIRAKLAKVLSDDESMRRSARATFRQFDNDQSNSLNFREVEKLLSKLSDNLQLPPVDSCTLQKIFQRYESKHSCGTLNIDEFEALYRDLLRLVQEKYYPQRKLVVRRSFFVGHRRLKDRPISELFHFVRNLGAGSFGEVHLTIEKSSQQERVIKTINKQQALLPIEQISAEVEILKSLDHPNIIKIFEVYEDYNNVYIVQEYCAGGELMERIAKATKLRKRISERNVADIVRRLLEAVSYCHEKKIAHKDLKPENIMFVTPDEDSLVKIIDFGVAEMFNQKDATSHRSAGTALYMAPEVYQMQFGLKCDVWSLGCIMYLLLSGKLPFVGRTLAEVKCKVSTTEPRWEEDFQGISAEPISVLKAMLTKNPNARASCRRLFCHPWFQTARDEVEVLTPEICKNLQRYMRQSNLKNALVNLMFHQMSISAPRIQKLANLFRTLDADGNGVLTVNELTSGLLSAGWKAWDINRIVSALDLDNSGEIDYTEFLAACYTWREAEMNVLWSAFSKIDTDGDGRITSDEFATVLLGGGSSSQTALLQKSEVEKLMAQIDINGDGYVEWDEFVRYIQEDFS